MCQVYNVYRDEWRVNVAPPLIYKSCFVFVYVNLCVARAFAVAFLSFVVVCVNMVKLLLSPHPDSTDSGYIHISIVTKSTSICTLIAIYATFVLISII